MPYIGNIEYHLVSDGIYWSDGGGIFGVVPRVAWALKLPPDNMNRVPLALNCLLIRSEDKVILVDTGLGNKLSEKLKTAFGIERPNGGLIDNLNAVGISPEDVDIVINTHLHADHCGGNTKHNSATNQITPTFPNAEYWIQRAELAAASYPNERTQATYFAENFVILQETGQLKVLTGDTTVASGVRTVITRGHTQAHQSVLLESGDEIGFYLADVAYTHHQFERTAWISAYDLEPLELIETKRRWQNWVADNNALVIFGHDTQVQTARFRREGRHFRTDRGAS